MQRLAVLRALSSRAPAVRRYASGGKDALDKLSSDDASGGKDALDKLSSDDKWIAPDLSAANNKWGGIKDAAEKFDALDNVKDAPNVWDALYYSQLLLCCSSVALVCYTLCRNLYYVGYLGHPRSLSEEERLRQEVARLTRELEKQRDSANKQK